MARESIRGVGRDAAGPLDITHRIHAYVKEHPGASREQIVAWAIENSGMPWFPLGHARRRYAAFLNGQRPYSRDDLRPADPSAGLRSSPRRRPEETPATIAARPFAIGDERAIRFLAGRCLKSMRSSGSLTGGPDGYTVVRELGETQGVTKAQMLVGYDEHRELHLRTELIRALRPDFDRLHSPHYRLSKKHRELLRLWLDAAMIHPPRPSTD